MEDEYAEFRAAVWKLLDAAYAELVAESQDRLIVGEGTGQPLGILTSAVAVAQPERDWTCRRGTWRRW